MKDTTAPVLDIVDLSVSYRRGMWRGRDTAVNGVSFRVGAGRTLGLVGESGSGKTTVARAIVGLVPVEKGEIFFCGEPIGHAGSARRRELSASVQMVFQDPYSSLNPARAIGQILVEPLMVHRKLAKAQLAEAVSSMLAKVGLEPEVARRYPGQFSGGQRQRIAIARALIVQPKLVVCDEPVSALDLSVQAQVLNLLRDLQEELSLTYLFVSHDLAVVRYMSDEIAVLRRGELVEYGDAQKVGEQPEHPYTKELLAAAPRPLQVTFGAPSATRAPGGSNDVSLPATAPGPAPK